MSEWISVKDRLPELIPSVDFDITHSEWVLICKSNGRMGVARWTSKSQWYLYMGPEARYVTHWMPLPEAPTL